MISKCANPDCAISLDYWQGRFFRFHKNYPEGAEPVNTHSVQHFWLCKLCSGLYTLECRRNVGVVIRSRRFAQLAKSEIFRRIAAA